MNYKILSLSLAGMHILIIGKNSYANNDFDCFSGLYMGGSLSYLTATSQLDQQVVSSQSQSHLRMAGQAPQVSVHVGYGQQINSPIYLGVEGKFAYTNYQGKYTSNDLINRSVNFEIKDSYSMLGKLGWNIKNLALTYIKLGFCSANMKLSGQELISKSTTESSSKKRVNGLEFGLGVDFLITKNIFLGVEYTHCHFQSLKVNTLKSNGSTMTTYKFQPQTNAVGLKLSWKI